MEDEHNSGKRKTEHAWRATGRRRGSKERRVRSEPTCGFIDS